MDDIADTSKQFRTAFVLLSGDGRKAMYAVLS